MKRNIIKKEKGAISTLVLFTVLMFAIILMGVYFSITTMQKSQLKSDIRITDIYGEDVENVEDMYIQKMGVCKVGEKYYLTLAEAINDTTNTSNKLTISMTKNTILTEVLSIAEGKNVEVILNEKTITGTIQNYGNLVLRGKGVVESKTGITIMNYGDLEISGATIKTSNSANNTIAQIEGNITLTSGTISNTAEQLENSNHRAIALEIHSGSAFLNGGKISSVCGRAIGNHGIIEIDGANITSASSDTNSYGVYATVCNFSDNGTYADGFITMKSGIIENTGGGYALSNGAPIANFTKTGGTIIGTKDGI